MRNAWWFGLWRDQGGQSTYVLLPPLMLVGTLLALGATTIQSVFNARQAMSRYEQIALQQVADSAVVAVPANGVEWTKATTPLSTASAQFTQVLSSEVAKTPWAHLPITVTAFAIFTPQDVGQAAPAGYPTATITAPGYYAQVQFPWKLDLLGGGQVTETVAASMQANIFDAPNNQWNP